MNKKTRWRVLIAFVVVVAGLGIFVWFARQKPAATPQGRFGGAGPMTVSTATATSGDMPIRLAALGTVTPLATVTVKTQINGQLQEIGFKEGQMVRKGDFLAQIDPRPYQNALAQAQGTLARDQASLTNARLDVKRYTDLLAQDSVSAQTLDTQKALVEQLIGTVATDEAQVNTSKLNLLYAHIVSPLSGRAGLRQVDVGNYVTTGDANGIVVITELDPISAIFPIPEDNVPQLLAQMHQGKGGLQVQAYDRANKNLLATGTMNTIDNAMDTATGTVKLRAQFDNKDNVLFPNQFVNIQLLVTTLHDQVLVPSAAIQHGSVNGVASSFVYLVGGDSTVTVTAVTLGATDGEKVAVTSGLKTGDMVVTEGGDRLRDGAKVQVAGAPPVSMDGAQGNFKRGNGNFKRDGKKRSNFPNGGAPGGNRPNGGGPPGGGRPDGAGAGAGANRGAGQAPGQ
ncbi:MAG: MdtA/MuxA family multidrug efflux RND transporter periplasmic adaptor subunit [Pseudomonadota bacterium]